MSKPKRKHWFLALFWIAGGINHFRVPKVYDAIMPKPLKRWDRQLTYASGVAEIAGGVAVLHPKSRLFGRWWIIATLAGVYPANIQMALNPERYAQIPAWALWARLPLQFVAGWWAFRATED
jgi:uncharacterized membrane protein